MLHTNTRKWVVIGTQDGFFVLQSVQMKDEYMLVKKCRVYNVDDSSLMVYDDNNFKEFPSIELNSGTFIRKR